MIIYLYLLIGVLVTTLASYLSRKKIIEAFETMVLKEHRIPIYMFCFIVSIFIWPIILFGELIEAFKNLRK